MKYNKHTGWLSAHLYYNEPWEPFLIDALAPYLNTLSGTEICQRFFFIRYWEQGPHIRLRVQGELSILKQMIQPNLEEHFLSFFESKPSVRKDPLDLLPDYKWLPNNSLQWISYQPEWHRYGGEAGLAEIEAQFHLSSKVVIQLLVEHRSIWNYEFAMGQAIKLHLSFAFALGLDLNQLQRFFQFYFYNWLPHSVKYSKNRFDQSAYNSYVGETLEAFREMYAQQSSGLIAFHQELYEALLEHADFQETWLNEWIDFHQDFANQIKVAQQSPHWQKRKLDYQFGSSWEMSLTPEEKERWMIFADLIHMTNNRLGILNKDEGYLAYLIEQSLKACS